jgi:hypothetical protein
MSNPVDLGLVMATEDSVTALILLHIHRRVRLEEFEALHAPLPIIEQERRLVLKVEKQLTDLGFPA